VLQCVAVCCILQIAPVGCALLPLVGVCVLERVSGWCKGDSMCCNMLECVAVCCSILQCVVICCSVFALRVGVRERGGISVSR